MLIICNGMPRSGSTLVYNLVRLYLDEVGKVNLLGFFHEAELYSEASKLERAARDECAHILKTHYRFDPSLLASSDRLLEIYTVRDLRDIGSSLMRIWDFSEQKVITALEQHTVIAEDYKNRSSALFLRYEDLEHDRERLFRHVSVFLDIPYSVEAAAKAVSGTDEMRKPGGAGASFKAGVYKVLRSINVSFGIGRVMRRTLPKPLVDGARDRVMFIDRNTMLHPGHVGKSDSKFDNTSVNSQIEATFGDWMVKHGYALTEPAVQRREA